MNRPGSIIEIPMRAGRDSRSMHVYRSYTYSSVCCLRSERAERHNGPRNFRDRKIETGTISLPADGFLSRRQGESCPFHRPGEMSADFYWSEVPREMKFTVDRTIADNRPVEDRFCWQTGWNRSEETMSERVTLREFLFGRCACR